jgi:23S rRNA (pseudouridine1915-N3)-methyltransferase
LIKIIAVGKLKEKYLIEASNEYIKRLIKYTKFKLIEISETNIYDDNKNKEVEKQNILKQISDKDYVIALNIEGEELSSVELSNKIKDLESNYKNIVFVIGSSTGLDEEITNRSNYQLSFSKLTFPHQLFRVILLEQIYRSYTIINNNSYHK